MVEVGQIYRGLGGRLVVKQVEDGRALLAYLHDLDDETWEDVDDVENVLELVAHA